MARWGRTLWAVGVGAVLATNALGEATSERTPRRDSRVSASAPSASARKGQLLAKAQVYSDLAQEMARLAEERAEHEQFKALAKAWRQDHHDSNGRIANYVLTRRVSFPDATFEGEEKNRLTAAMIQLEHLKRLEGAQFERSFAVAASQLPALAARELMTARQQFSDDHELLGVIDPLMTALDKHRQDAEALVEQFGGPAAARRPPAQR